MSESKQIKDFSNEVKVKIPEYIDPVKKEFTEENLEEALTNLLALEKKTRLASDMNSTRELAHAILQLLRDFNKWKLLNNHISLLCKRRAQLKKVMQNVIQDGVKYVEETPNKETKIELIETLRIVSSGKLFVELERARLTRTLAEIREKEGDGEKACELLQDVQVETIGSMEAKEKCSFILNQMRLCLLTKNYVRAEIVSKKIHKNIIEGEDFNEQKLQFYRQLIELYLHQDKYLEIAKAYEKCFRTKTIQDDEAKWKPVLKNAIMFLLLSPFDSEVSDFLARLIAEKKTMQLPSCMDVLKEMTKDELTPWPFKCESDWKQTNAFKGEEGEKRLAVLHKRVVQHNIWVVAKYYSRIKTARFAQLLQLDEDKTEEFLSEMVSSKQLFAKIDRPAGIIVFDQKKSSNDVLNEWGGDVRSLLSLVEKTCHIINKENMIYKKK